MVFYYRLESDFRSNYHRKRIQSETNNYLRKFKITRLSKGEGRDPNNEWIPEQSFLVVGISRKKAIELAVKFGQRAIIYGETNQPGELIETLFTQGNCEIIRHRKDAFLCSRKIPAGIVLKCYDWAIEQREAGNCVISGFHSTIEKRCSTLPFERHTAANFSFGSRLKEKSRHRT